MRLDEILGPDTFDRDSSVDDILYEMSNISSNVTGFQQNIQLWIRTDSTDHEHNRYRVKIRKNNQWAGVYLVNSNPILIAPGHISLSTSEDKQIKAFIVQFSSLIIGLIDEKLSTDDFILTVLKIRNS